jgi:phosphoribosylformylglycinamidine cyclo-ligase
VLPLGCDAAIDLDAWQPPAIFRQLQEKGNVERNEMLRTFNCGIGMVVCVPAGQAETARGILENEGETVYRIGTIVKSDGGNPHVHLSGGAF